MLAYQYEVCGCALIEMDEEIIRRLDTYAEFFCIQPSLCKLSTKLFVKNLIHHYNRGLAERRRSVEFSLFKGQHCIGDVLEKAV
jgi:hypothetical protein